MLKQLLQRWRRPTIASGDALATFLDQNASLIAQKTIIGYCTVKTMLPLPELTKEKPFADALEISRWEAYAAALADLMVVAEGRLRPAAGGRSYELAARLADVYGSRLAAHPVPAHKTEGWAEEVAALRQRLTTAQLAPPMAIADIALTCAEKIFTTLPIHESLREPDKPAIMANVQFLMVGMAHRFNSEIDSAAIVADLMGAARVA
jgi:hypothetical protein